jgi:hypothetical protein
MPQPARGPRQDRRPQKATRPPACAGHGAGRRGRRRAGRRQISGRDRGVAADAPQPAWRRAAVDGKTLRGSGHHGHAQVHLLAAMDHTSCAVLARPTSITPPTRSPGSGPYWTGWISPGGHHRRRTAHPSRPPRLAGHRQARRLRPDRKDQPTHPALPAGHPAVARHPSPGPTPATAATTAALHTSATPPSPRTPPRPAPTPPPGHGEPAQPRHRHPAPARLAQPRRRGAPQRPRRHPSPATPWHHQPMKRHHLHPRRGPARAAHQRPPDPVVHGLLRVPMTVCAGRPG